MKQLLIHFEGREYSIDYKEELINDLIVYTIGINDNYLQTLCGKMFSILRKESQTPVFWYSWSYTDNGKHLKQSITEALQALRK